jgi:hypothetical protein
VLPSLDLPSPPICLVGCCMASHCVATLVAGCFCCQLLTVALRWSRHQPPLAFCCSFCWLVVAFLSAPTARFHHCTPLCYCQCSCRWLLLPPIVGRCPQVVSSPATTHLFCSCHWLVAVLLSADPIHHHLVIVHCQHRQMALPIATVPTTSHHWPLF